jgi:hypothetical protein
MSNNKADDLSDCEISKMTETEVTVTPEVAATMWQSFHGPLAIDHAIRSAVSLCWMMLPDDRRNADVVECELRRLLDRVIANLREDVKAFGRSN